MEKKPLCAYDGKYKELKSGDYISASQTVEVVVFDADEDVSTGDGKAFFVIPAAMDYCTLTEVGGQSLGKGSAGTTSVQLRRDRPGMIVDVVDLFSTLLDITTAFHTETAVIKSDGSQVVQKGDIVYIDVDAARTGAKGLIIVCEFERI